MAITANESMPLLRELVRGALSPRKALHTLASYITVYTHMVDFVCVCPFETYCDVFVVNELLYSVRARAKRWNKFTIL